MLIHESWWPSLLEKFDLAHDVWIELVYNMLVLNLLLTSESSLE